MEAIFGWKKGGKAKGGKAKGGKESARDRRAKEERRRAIKAEKKRRKLERMGVVLGAKKGKKKEEEAGRGEEEEEGRGADQGIPTARGKKKKRKDASEPAKPAKRARREEAELEAGANPYLDAYREWWRNAPDDMGRLLDPSLDDERRGELFDLMPFDMPERFSWAVPDERALRALLHFGPVVEVGCGGGYWGSLLRARGGDYVGFDREVRAGAAAHVRRGGPEELRAHAGRTLFLCYPDDFEESAESLAARCLAEYGGDTVAHAGELLGDTLQENPWGKTTGGAFQELLAADFHCVLRVPLPSWPGSNDSLTVWRRTPRCDVDDISFRHVPAGETLRVAAAAPCAEHLLRE